MQHTLCAVASAPSLEVVGSKRNLVTPLLRPGPVRVEMIDNAFPGRALRSRNFLLSEIADDVHGRTDCFSPSLSLASALAAFQIISEHDLQALELLVSFPCKTCGSTTRPQEELCPGKGSRYEMNKMIVHSQFISIPYALGHWTDIMHDGIKLPSKHRRLTCPWHVS